VEVAKLLLDNGAQLSGSAMCCVVFANSPRVIKLFDEYRAEEQSRNCAELAAMEAKAAPLLGAAEKGDLTVLRRCLRIGNPLHSHDRKGDTALHIAVRYNHIPAVRFLLGKGAEVNATNFFTQTSLHVAAGCGHNDAVLCLLKIDNIAGQEASRHPSRAGFKRFLHSLAHHKRASALSSIARVDIEAKDSIGRTPLYLAAKEGRIDTGRLLLDVGADIIRHHVGLRVLLSRPISMFQ
jgi:ankyrin repeat protein